MTFVHFFGMFLRILQMLELTGVLQCLQQNSNLEGSSLCALWVGLLGWVGVFMVVGLMCLVGVFLVVGLVGGCIVCQSVGARGHTSTHTYTCSRERA